MRWLLTIDKHLTPTKKRPNYLAHIFGCFERNNLSICRQQQQINLFLVEKWNKMFLSYQKPIESPKCITIEIRFDTLFSQQVKRGPTNCSLIIGASRRKQRKGRYQTKLLIYCLYKSSVISLAILLVVVSLIRLHFSRMYTNHSHGKQNLNLHSVTIPFASISHPSRTLFCHCIETENFMSFLFLLISFAFRWNHLHLVLYSGTVQWNESWRRSEYWCTNGVRRWRIESTKSATTI